MKKKTILIGIVLYIGMMFMISLLRSSEAGVTVTIKQDFPVYQHAEDLIQHADHIISGKVEELQPDIKISEDGKLQQAHTTYRIKVTKVYKGEDSEKEITLSGYGARNEQTLYLYEDASLLSIGKEYLLFSDQNHILLNPLQCAYQMDYEKSASSYRSHTITLQELLALLDK